MCACEPDFTCSRCTGTSADPHREPEPETTAERRDRERTEGWEGGGDASQR